MAISTQVSSKTPSTPDAAAPPEPIAIVGIGCRFPGGASNPKAFWDLLRNGADAIVEVPADRWDARRFYDPDPDKAGKTYVKQGGFLKERIEYFDPLAFGMSPREAHSLDPQQRLLLEVTWEALEDAGLPLENLAGSRTGVFIGAFALDMKMLQSSTFNRDYLLSFSTTGASMTLLANRLSYVFDWRGPSLAVDTACSSSLVATHYACQSIWRGESTLAIAGGANVMLRPEYFMVMCKGHFLSPNGRCRAFDSRADGYVRGEGAGVVVLKPLAAALADKDPIYAVIRATGVNQDGQTAGISLPNQDAQEELVRSVYRQAGVEPGKVRYIEAHGTGTKAGDPVEARALDSALSEGRGRERPCFVGSVKTNIGHLEAAAGVAGLIKAALCLEHRQIPPNLHFETPNPDIPFDRMCLRVPTALEDWPDGESAAYAGVNSFGYGGTNAHVLLEAAPRDTREGEAAAAMKALLVPVSARTDQALAATAADYGAFLARANGSVSLEDFCHTASLRRSHHYRRAAMVVESLDDVRAMLRSIETGAPSPGLSTTQAGVEDRRPVFVYTGMGPQWWAMGRELIAGEPVFRETVDACDAVFTRYAGWSIRDALLASEEESKMARTEVAQPANFVVQAALTALWKSWGIAPDAVAGHSVGEVAAAYVSGALSLEDALLVSYHRSRLQQTRGGLGTMLAAGLSEEAAVDLIEPFARRVDLAAVNSGSSVTIAGELGALQKIAQTLQDRGVFHRFLHVEVAYHSAQMDAIREDLLQSLAAVQPREARIPLYSSVTGELLSGAALDSEYWWRNVRQPVRFGHAMQSLIAAGYRTFVEVGPHPVLQNAIAEAMRAGNANGKTAASLHRDKPERTAMLQGLGTLYALGLNPDWKALTPRGARYVKLPGYAWQRDFYWHESAASREDRLGTTGSAFLSTPLHLPKPAWEVELNSAFFPYLADHRLDNAVVFPGAGYVEAGLALSQSLRPQEALALEGLQFRKMLIVDSKDVAVLHLRLDPDTKEYSVFSRSKVGGVPWELHATGKIVSGAGRERPSVDPEALRALCPVEISSESFYKRLELSRFYYGPYFRTLGRIWIGHDQALGRLEAHPALGEDAAPYMAHPTLVDGSLQLMTLMAVLRAGRPWVPTRIERAVVFAPPESSCWVHTRTVKRGKGSLTADIVLFDSDGRVSVQLTGVHSQEIATGAVPDTWPQWLYSWSWKPIEQTAEAHDTERTAWLVFGGEDAPTAAVLDWLKTREIPSTLVTAAGGFSPAGNRRYTVDPESTAAMKRLFEEDAVAACKNILYLWDRGEPAHDPSTDFEAALRHCGALLHLVQALPAEQVEPGTRLAVVTRDADALLPQENLTDPAAETLWGMMRVIRQEYRGLTCQLLDIDRSPTAADIGLAMEQILAPSPEPEILVREGAAFAHRLERVVDALRQDEPQPTATTQPLEMIVGTPGRLDSLRYHAARRRAPGEGEVEIRVHAAALNYKDLLKAMGTIADQVLEGTYFGTAFGMECSGIVAAVGQGVVGFRAGDEVIATTNNGAFRTFVTTRADYVIPKPAALSMHEAPAFTVFMTAYYGLVDVARLERGERVLIHNAAGGVGLAAVQIAQGIGAEIYATAGSDAKRAFLRELGVPYVMDSRSLQFAEEITAWTGGRGVDVILNAMSGEALRKSFGLLAPYGRFVEIGKKDIAENSGLPMETFNRNVSFSAIDLDRIFRDRPVLARRLFESVAGGFAKGDLRALPTTVFPAAEAEGAFRLMAQSKHMGKVVIDLTEQKVAALPEASGNPVRGDGTYLITGGTRGFGLEIAKWLTTLGARHLVLLSRSGAADEESRQAVMAMRGSGVEVLAEPVDVADGGRLAALIERVSQTMPPLRGVIHGAMVLDDGLIPGLDTDRLRRVMAPKVLGTVNLHAATTGLPLDFFVMMSSVSSLAGNPGQACYAAANAYLDGFCRFRRALGLPATTINWGALGEVGVVARNAQVEQFLAASGIRVMPMDHALHALGRALQIDAAQLGVLQVDWYRWRSSHSGGSNGKVFEALFAEFSGAAGSAALEPLHQLLNTLAPLPLSDRLDFMQGLLAEELARVLQMPAAQLDRQQNVMHLGIDSLMAVELQTALQGKFGLELSAMELTRGLSVSQLAARLLSNMEAELETRSAESNLSESELDALLAAEGAGVSEEAWDRLVKKAAN